jgi:hypothetical protein
VVCTTRTPGFRAPYARQTYVEGFFGTLKNAAVANLDRDAYRSDCLGLKLLHVGLCCAITSNRLDLPDLLIAEDEYPDEHPLTDAA